MDAAVPVALRCGPECHRLTTANAALAERAAPTPVFAGILVCSVGVLMQEVLLTRIFSFTIWYHLAYLTISTALLGFGAAGTILSLAPGTVERIPRRLAAWSSAGAGVALLAGLSIVGPRPISPDALSAEPARFAAGLLGYYAAVTLPFLLAGIAVATPLAAYPRVANRLYAADLLGAGLGCAAAVAALSWLDGETAIGVCAALFFAAAALYAEPRTQRAGFAAATLALALGSPLAGHLIDLQPTATKTLGRALREGARILETRWSPVNRVDLYERESSLGGFWTTYGRPRHRDPGLPRSLSLVYDAHNGSDVYEVRGRRSLRFLDGHLLGLPYALDTPERVLVIGVGGGIDVLNALYHGAAHVTAVELQPATLDLHRDRLAHWTGGWLERPEVELVAAEGRHYVRSHPDEHDLIQITAVDTFAAQTTGAYVLAESYLYSVEAFGDFLDHLTPDGVLSVAIGDLLYNDPEIPTPYSARLALVAREALRRRGVEDARAHIALAGQGIPNFRAAPDQIVAGAWIQVLLVKRNPFTSEETGRLRDYLDEAGFALRLAPDGGDDDRHLGGLVFADANILPEALDAQVYDVAPITDDRPFFFHVLPWSGLVLDGRIDWTHPGSGTGQLVLLMMLGQAVVLGGALVALPLLRGARGALPTRSTAGFLLYFLALGLGFLLVEISFVQKYVLLLGYPTYSLSVTLFSLLVFAAAGSALSRRFWRRPRRLLGGLLGATLVLLALEIVALPWLREQLLAASLIARIATTVLLQLPLGLALGMYFPTGLELLRQREPHLVPWAWAVNGVASVAASVLAVILGMAIGFSGVAVVAGGIYTVGTVSLLAVLRSEHAG
jgi:hypothetical protein